ncbi:MAG: GtrA family protein, partial [Prevotella nanceiensis]|nr:GtrA family protein [Hoylesella nanceiensis]
MKKIFSLFKIQKEERLLVLFFLVVLVALNGLVINLYYDKFTPFTRFYWPLFIRNFHVSGFDPITYSIISDWWAGYNVYRHPLLAFFMYPFYLLNKLLMYITGINCAIFIMPFLQTFCGIYGFVFFYRILRTSLKLRRFDASLLTIMLFSFAYILLSCIVPDHFIMSFFMLVFTLYVASQRIDKQLLLTKTQTVLLFVVTGGISLNNGLKVFLASLFVNGKKFFNWRHLLLAIILPSAVMWGVSKWEY